MGDQGTTAYILISGEVKITTTPGDRTHCGVASLGKTLTARAESRSGRPYLPLVHTVSRTDTLAVRSYVLDQLTRSEPSLPEAIPRNLASG